MNELSMREEHVRAAEREVAAHPARARLAALAFDVLSRQAEGRVLFAGKEFVESRAAAHGVTRDDAAVAGTNLLTALERGPENANELALVSAFAVAGAAPSLGKSGAEGEEAAARFVRHADYLEISTGYAVYPFVRTLLDEGARGKLVAALQATVRTLAAKDATARDAGTKHLAFAASRLAALVLLGADDVVAALARELDEPELRELARAVVRRGPSTETLLDGVAIAGRWGGRPSGTLRTFARWVTGVAFAAWVVRGLAFLVGAQRTVRAQVVGSAVRVEREWTWLGRVIRKREETWNVASIVTAARDVRFPGLLLAAGVASLALGTCAGAWLFGDGLSANEPSLLAIAVVVVAAGLVLDLLVDVFFEGRRGRVAIEVRTLKGRGARIVGVSLPEADAFLRALSSKLRAPRT